MEQLDNLPDEILLNIFSFFNKRDHGQASIVDKHFYKVSTDKSLNNLPWPLLDYSQPPFQVKTLIDNQNIYNAVIVSKWKILFTSKVPASGNHQSRITLMYDVEKNECQKLKKLTLHTESELFPLANGHVLSSIRIPGNRYGLKIIDILQEHCTHTIDGHTDLITAAIELTNGHVITTAADNTLKIWNVAKDESLATIKTRYYQPIKKLLALSTGLVASGFDGTSGTIGIWDINLGKCLYSLIHNSQLSTLIELPTGELLSAASNGTIKLWEINVLPKPYLHTFTMPDFEIIKLMVVLPNQKQVMMVSQHKNEIVFWRWDIEKRKLHDPITVNYQGYIESLAVLPNGQIITIGSRNIQCWFFPELKFENEITETNLSSKLNKFDLNFS